MIIKKPRTTAELAFTRRLPQKYCDDSDIWEQESEDRRERTMPSTRPITEKAGLELRL